MSNDGINADLPSSFKVGLPSASQPTKGAVSMMNGILEYDYFMVKPMIKRKKAAEAALKFTV